MITKTSKFHHRMRVAGKYVSYKQYFVKIFQSNIVYRMVIKWLVCGV